MKWKAGDNPKSLRAKSIAIHGLKCFYCKGALTTAWPGEPPAIDHIKPKSQGGLSTIDNVVPVCHRCNSSKWAHSLSEWALRVNKQLIEARKIVRRNNRILKTISEELSYEDGTAIWPMTLETEDKK